MKRIIFTVLLLFIYSVNLFAQTNLSKEEYAVYDAVLESRYKEFLKQSRVKSSFVISSETVKLDFIPTDLMNKKPLLNYSNERLQSYPDLLNDFKEKNQFSVNLEKQLPTEYEYYLVSKGELDKLLEEGKKEQAEYFKICNSCSLGDGFVWQPLRRKYPNSTGYSKFSRIGFSSDNKFALVFINSEAAGYGSSMFYILEIADNKWNVKEYVWVTFWVT